MSSVPIAGLIVAAAVALLLVLVVYAGGYRLSRYEHLLRQYATAQAEFVELRRRIRRYHTRRVEVLQQELDAYLDRLQALRRKIRREYGMEVAEGDGDGSSRAGEDGGHERFDVKEHFQELEALGRDAPERVAAMVRQVLRGEPEKGA